MKILSAKCVISAVRPGQYPSAGHPEIAIVGRSNVGKSSLINSLCTRRALARTSSLPGKTQTINFFAINEELYLVDLPGYGYAAKSKGIYTFWGSGLVTCSLVHCYVMKRQRRSIAYAEDASE